MKQIWVKNLFLHVKKKILFSLIFYYIQYFSKKKGIVVVAIRQNLWIPHKIAAIFIENFYLPYKFSKTLTKILLNISDANYTKLCNWNHNLEAKNIQQKSCQTAPNLVKNTLKMNTPPSGGGCWIFLVIFLLTHYKVMIFLLTQTMRLNGCLKEKINVIRPLENFLRHFEKKVSTFFEPKWTVNLEKFSANFLFKIFLKNFFDENFWLQMPLKIFWTTFWIHSGYEKCSPRSKLSNET